MEHYYTFKVIFDEITVTAKNEDEAYEKLQRRFTDEPDLVDLYDVDGGEIDYDAILDGRRCEE